MNTFARDATTLFILVAIALLAAATTGAIKELRADLNRTLDVLVTARYCQCNSPLP